MADEEIAERVVTDENTVWYTILRTCREEFVVAIREYAEPEERDRLVALVEGASKSQMEHAARKLGDILMEGGDYWEGIPVAVERALG